MKATQDLHDLGQSLWLDNITRNLLKTGVLRRYIDELSVTGLTSNPTIFDHAITKSAAYDADIRAMTKSGVSREKSSVTLMGTPLKMASSIAGAPSLVPGILMKRLGLAAAACSDFAASTVRCVS